MEKDEINLDNVIVINLKRATERKEMMEKQLQVNGIVPAFYPAIDGNQIANPGMDLKVMAPNYMSGNKINKNEVACLFSHIGALTLAKLSGFDYIIIMEDDIVLCDDFKTRLADLFKRLPKGPNGWEHVFLSAKTYGANPLITPSLVPTRSRVSGAYAYMVHSRAYDKLIERLSKFDTVTDDIIERFILHEKGLKSFVYHPFFAYPKTDTSYIRKVESGHLLDHESKKHFKRNL